MTILQILSIGNARRGCTGLPETAHSEFTGRKVRTHRNCEWRSESRGHDHGQSAATSKHPRDIAAQHTLYRLDSLTNDASGPRRHAHMVSDCRAEQTAARVVAWRRSFSKGCSTRLMWLQQQHPTGDPAPGAADAGKDMLVHWLERCARVVSVK